MDTAALNTYAKGFPFQFIAIGFQSLLKDMVHIVERPIFDLQYVMDPWNTAQQFHNLVVFAFVFAANFDMIPVAYYGQGLIAGFHNVTNAACEYFNKAQTHRLALDGDFWKQFNDKLHGSLLLAGENTGS